MKPKYIFSAVLAVCLMMFAVLPRLAHGSVSMAAPSAASASAAGSLAEIAAANSVAAPIQAGLQPGPTLVGGEILVSPTAPPEQPPDQPQAQSPPDQSDSNPQDAAVTIDSREAAIPVLPTLAPDAASTALAAAGAPVPHTASLTDLDSFTRSVSDGQDNTVTGVYVDGVLALPVAQQPSGQDQYVTDEEGAITQYSRAARYGAIGLLAHNTLSGREFFNLKAGQQVALVYGSGRQVRYKIKTVEYYQAISSHDPYSDFVDLNNAGGRVLDHEELFRHLYTVDNQLVFQTCFAANGDLSWGRMFVIAEPE